METDFRTGKATMDAKDMHAVPYVRGKWNILGNCCVLESVSTIPVRPVLAITKTLMLLDRSRLYILPVQVGKYNYAPIDGKHRL